MADMKISDLTAATSASGAMQLEVNDSATSKSVTVDQLKAYFLPAGGITSTEIATDAVGSAEIAAGAVGTAELADGSVTGVKLEVSGVTAGTYGTATDIPAITVDSKGRVTGVSVNPITIGSRTLIVSGSLPAASSLTLSSIPQTYKDLKIVIKRWSGATTAGYLQLQPNSDTTAANYNGGYCGSAVVVASPIASLTYSSATQAVAAVGDASITIENYAATDTVKMSTGVVNLSGTSGQFNYIGYVSLSAITSLKILLSAGTFDGGTYELWGIK